MEINLLDITGLEIHINQENCGFLKAVLIKDANGGVTGVLNDKKRFFPAKNVVSTKGSIVLSDYRTENPDGKNWLGLRVETRSGKKKGKISNIFFDDNLTQVKKIEIIKKIFLFFNRKLIVSSNLIFDVQDNKVIIIDDTQKKGLEISLAPSNA